MEDKDKQSYARLPEGFQDLEPSLNEYLAFSKEADRQIIELNRDIAPQPRFDPPGMDRTNGNLTKQATISRLIKEKSELYQQFDTKLQRAINSVEAKKAAELKSVVNYHLEGNQFKGLDREQMKALKGDEKKLPEGFSYIEQQYFQEYDSHVDLKQLSKERSLEEMSEVYMDLLGNTEDTGHEDMEPDKD
ncbi:hypothetical protein ACFQ3S_17410 [Mucilaginibacter terrae]|uniref:hypothetical protein n=1 Tax=Mucilaginibacter terrae TaxID=1955052 RepID=UPI0036435DE1